MLKTVLRRMFSNSWLIICLLLGSIMATALVSCIPIYTDGILQRMLTKDMESYQLETGKFPGQYSVRAIFNYNRNIEERISNQRYFDREIKANRLQEVGLPIMSASHHLVMGSLSFPLVPAEKYDSSSNMVYARLGTLSDLQDHINITKGRMFSDQVADEVIEVIVSQQAMVIQDLLLDKVYTLLDPTRNTAKYAR